jgi:uroporphyrin-III C-methyltransferase
VVPLDTGVSVTGTVHLVGAGPGAPDLLTVRAARLLEQADIVFHDALVHPRTLAMAARAVTVPVGKRCGRHSTAQAFINKRLIDAARKYRTVVRLKGGDPMVFARSQEEIDALTAAGVRVDVVPGVTAALAAAAELGVSLTRRGRSRSLTLITPRTGAGDAEHDWSTALAQGGTAAIYMGAGQAERVQRDLLDKGYDRAMPVALCESVSLPQARTLRGRLADLPRLAAQAGDGPVLILVGEVLEASTAPRAHLPCPDPALAPPLEPPRPIARSAP